MINLRSVSREKHCTKKEFFHKGFLQYMWANPQYPVSCDRNCNKIKVNLLRIKIERYYLIIMTIPCSHYSKEWRLSALRIFIWNYVVKTLRLWMMREKVRCMMEAWSPIIKLTTLNQTIRTGIHIKSGLIVIDAFILYAW